MLPQKFRISAVVIILLAVFGILASAENASAQLRIRFEDPDQPLVPALTIDDNGTGDVDLTVGRILVVGTPYAGKFIINSSVVKSKPILGNTTQSEVDANVSVRMVLAGRLLVTTADTDFTNPSSEPSLTLSSHVGGSLTGASTTVSFTAWADAANGSPLNSPAPTAPSGSASVALGPFSSPPASYSGSGSTTFARSGLYSMFQQALVVAAAGGAATFDHGTLVKELRSSTTLTSSPLNPTTVIAGTPVTLTVDEKNTGETTITGVNVTGTGCSPWTGGLATLAPNDSTTFSCSFTPSVTTTWTATGHGTDPLGNPVPGDGETTGGTVTVFTASTSLTTKDVSPATTVAPGTVVTVTVTETNTGNSAISNVNVTGTGACTSFSPASVASLAAGASVDFTCTFTANNSDTWTATGHGTDIQSNPVSLSGETTSGSVTVIKASTTLTTKSVSPSTTVAVGTPVTITVTETNTGNSTITNVNVTGTGACTAYTPASVASLAMGASVDFSCTFTATTDTSWTATGHGTDALNQPVSEQGETTSGSIVVQQASTVLNTKLVSPATTVIAGTPVTITVTETNTGNSTITNVNVTGTGCTAWTPASVASLAAGASFDFSCAFTPATTTAWTATGHGTDAAHNPVSLNNETTNGTVTVLQLASLGDFVWEDSNADGIQDADEPGIPSATVKLLNCSDSSVVATTLTNGNGLYLFTGLTPGCYKVQFPTPAGYGASPANQGSNDAIDSDSVGGVTGNYTLAAGETNLTVDAGFYLTVGTGRFTGGGKQIDVGGVAITSGLTIHCDLLLSNNFEINWKSGGSEHQFHMLDHFLTIACTDDPAIKQKPPVAPLDTLHGVGYGRYDGKEGYTVDFILVDAGEPGRNDTATIRIFETANPSNVVLNLPATFLIGGNLQAHYDQPHKNK